MTAKSTSDLYELYEKLGNLLEQRRRGKDAADFLALAIYYARQEKHDAKTHELTERIRVLNPNHVLLRDPKSPLFFAQLLMRYPADEAERICTTLERQPIPEPVLPPAPPPKPKPIETSRAVVESADAPPEAGLGPSTSSVRESAVRRNPVDLTQQIVASPMSATPKPTNSNAPSAPVAAKPIAPSSANTASAKNPPSTPSAPMPGATAPSAAPAPIVWEVPAGDALKKVGKADTVDSFLGDFLSNQLGKNVASLSQGSSLSNLKGRMGPSSVEPPTAAPAMPVEPAASQPRATEPVTAPAARLEEPVPTTEPKAESVFAPANTPAVPKQVETPKAVTAPAAPSLPSNKMMPAMPPMPPKEPTSPPAKLPEQPMLLGEMTPSMPPAPEPEPEPEPEMQSYETKTPASVQMPSQHVGSSGLAKPFFFAPNETAVMSDPGRSYLPPTALPTNVAHSLEPRRVENHQVFDLGQSLRPEQARALLTAEDFLMRELQTANQEVTNAPFVAPLHRHRRPTVSPALNVVAVLMVLVAVGALGFFGQALYPAVARLDVPKMLNVVVNDLTGRDLRSTPMYEGNDQVLGGVKEPESVNAAEKSSNPMR